MRFQVYINDRDYSSWEFKNVHNEDIIDIQEFPILKTVNPLVSKLFSRDIISFNENNDLLVENSVLKDTEYIAAVLILEGNKTYGRTKNNRLLYKCIPNDKYLPSFLVPYDVKIGFSKKNINKYIVFKYDHWNEKHPRGVMVNVLGDVNNLEVFYEYQLYSKSLHISLTEFTNSTRKVLNKIPHDEFIQQIMNNQQYQVEDRRSLRIITIDPPNSSDFDDAFGIEPFYVDNTQTGWTVTVYIANVFIWLETLELWNTFSHRVSTIYLPDRKRPMLPTILSDTLCSLQEKQNRFSFAMDVPVTIDGKIDLNRNIEYKNVLINVHKNYRYEENNLLFKESVYTKLFDITFLMDNRILNSHDIVSHWMVFMNAITGIRMLKDKIGIFRSVIKNEDNDLSLDKYQLSNETKRVIVNWNNISGHYINYDDNAIINHQLLNINPKSYLANYTKNQDIIPYIHLTSPIRRLVDLLNQIIIFKHYSFANKLSDKAEKFLYEWIDKLDYINVSMRSIKKLQNDCMLLYNCITTPSYLNKTHEGVVFDKVKRNNGSFNYTVYLEGLKMISRITTHYELENYSHTKFRLFMFEAEDNIKKKVKLQIVQ